MTTEVDDFLRANPDVSTIEVLLPDINGVMRGKWLPSSKLASVYNGELKLPKSTFFLDIWGRDVAELVFAQGDQDGICYPIEGTLLPTPYAEDSSQGQLMLTMFADDGAPYLGDPRQILKRTLARFRARNWRPVVAVELEFSLAHWNGEELLHPGIHQSQTAPLGGDLYDLQHLKKHQPLFDEIQQACLLQRLPFDGVIKEAAPSQFEINMHHVDCPVLAARQILMMKRIIKELSRKHGLCASFMPKPFAGEAGNGMHVHCSILDERGTNVFDDGTNRGTAELLAAVGGCLDNLADSFAVLAPSYNAFRRFVRRSHAPNTPCWGYDNRTVAIRIPAGKPSSRRIEHRVAGADANPYLILAVILGAILDGIEQNLMPGDPTSGNAYQNSEASLPTHMPAALDTFEASPFIHKVLGTEFQRSFAMTKRQEYDEFARQVSRFEYQAYAERL
ncbi:MAG: glutamine synthetase family protein [Pseudomonadota bacterium]